MKTTLPRIKVTAKTLARRIARRLPVGQHIVHLRGAAEKLRGRWAVVSDSGAVLREDVDVAALARELDCMPPWEELAP
jgi:hypothetical protein